MSADVETLSAEDVPAAASSSFYAAMRVLPRSQRDAMYHVYAFCRAVDDVADGGGSREVRHADLIRYRTDIEQLYSTGRVTSRTRDLIGPVNQYGLLQDDFIAVIDGMEMDIVRDLRAPEWKVLDLYCDRAASAVGRLSVRIFGWKRRRALSFPTTSAAPCN